MQESRGKKTIGEIVAADFRTARVFENHVIDFCCGGKVALEATCTGFSFSTGRMNRFLKTSQ